MSMPVRLRLNTSKSARAPAASRLGSLWRTNPLYLSHPEELTLLVLSSVSELQ